MAKPNLMAQSDIPDAVVLVEKLRRIKMAHRTIERSCSDSSEVDLYCRYAGLGDFGLRAGSLLLALSAEIQHLRMGLCKLGVDPGPALVQRVRLQLYE